MIKSVHEKLKRWGDWARLSDNRGASTSSVLLVAARRNALGMSFGKERSAEMALRGVDLRHRLVDCPSCGTFPLRVGSKCPKCKRTVYAGDHDHKLRQPKDDSGKVAHNISINSDPEAEQIDRLLAEFKGYHESAKYHAVKQKYFYWENDAAGAKRLGISVKTYKGHIDDVQYWLDGRLRGLVAETA
jgi:hypothetical protein